MYCTFTRTRMKTLSRQRSRNRLRQQREWQCASLHIYDIFTSTKRQMTMAVDARTMLIKSRDWCVPSQHCRGTLGRRSPGGPIILVCHKTPARRCEDTNIQTHQGSWEQHVFPPHRLATISDQRHRVTYRSTRSASCARLQNGGV